MAAFECTSCRKLLTDTDRVHYARCRTCGQNGLLCQSCKRKHLPVHKHELPPLQTLRRQSLLKNEEESDEITTT
jgi:hypothetical protein